MIIDRKRGGLTMASLQRIQFVSRLMAWFCWLPIAMILLVVLFGGQQEHAVINIEKDTSTDSVSFAYSSGGIHISSEVIEERFQSPGDFGLALVTSLPSLALLFGLLHIRKLFKIYSFGEFFTVTTASHLKWFSLSLIAYGVLRPLGILEKDLIDRFAEAESLQHTWEVPDFGISVFFLGLLLLVISWVMGEAARLADYNKSIV